MATLNIGGQRVKVDDAFLSMTPEQQQQTVDEIAGQLGLEGEAPPGAPAPQRQGDDIFGAGLTALENTIEGIPFLGPITQGVSDLVGTQATGLITGQDPAELQEFLNQRRQGRDERFPVAAVSGNLAGGIGAMGALGALPGGAAALGMEGNLLARMGNSAMSGAGISTADALARGNGGMDALAEGGVDGAVAGAIPGIGAVVKAAARPFARPIGETVRGLTNPGREAGRSVAGALTRDRQNIAAPVMSSMDEATARMNGQPILNVDRGGETTRALMRSAANQNPEARGIVEKVSEDRFRTQSNRAVNFFRRVLGGDVDDLARKAQIKAQSIPANAAAYDAAKNAPAARAIWTPEIRQLMQSDSFRSAIKAAESRGTDVAAARGFKAVRSPFVFGQDGTVLLKRNPDGSTALPSLEFWDQVKRNLDGMIGTAKRQGDNTLFADLTALKQTLVGTLDAAVPAYKQARGTAAAFFDATDAVDAGRKAFSSPKALDESLAVLNGMSKSEKDDFALGMVSQMMDDVRSVNNRSNLTRMFDVPARKELMEAALGPGKARQFEAFVRVEDIMDKVRGALGNSTTARQLAELGISGGLGVGAGGVTMLGGGDINSAATVAMLTAAGRHGFRTMRGKANENVLKKVAEMLASSDEGEISKAMANAMLSQQHMLALEAIQKGIGVTARGAALSPTLN
jgi:hypothetical protein